MTKKKLRKVRAKQIRYRAKAARDMKPEPFSPADEYRFGVRSKR